MKRQTDTPKRIPSHPGVYDEIGTDYRRHRLPDRRIADQIESALGDARTVCNVGAGTGAYEPTSRDVIALEPDVRACILALAQFDPVLVDRGIDRLRDDLASGAWHRQHADALELDVMDWGYRLVICDPS